MASALVLINRNSGTVRSRGADAVADLVREQLAGVFTPLDVRLFEGDIASEITTAGKKIGRASCRERVSNCV